MSLDEVAAVLQTRIAGREGICTQLVRLGDDVQVRNTLPVEPEQARAEVASGVDDAVAVARPELRLLLAASSPREQMAVSRAKLDAGGEGFENAGIGPSRRQLLELFLGICRYRVSATRTLQASDI